MSNILTNLLKKEHHHTDCYASCRLIFLLCVCFASIRQHDRQILYFKLHVDGRKFHYRRPQVEHRWPRASWSERAYSKHWWIQTRRWLYL